MAKRHWDFGFTVFMTKLTKLTVGVGGVRDVLFACPLAISYPRELRGSMEVTSIVVVIFSFTLVKHISSIILGADLGAVLGGICVISLIRLHGDSHPYQK